MRHFAYSMWVGAAILATSVASAAEYPSKPITVLVPFAAGSGTDVNTRQVTNVMARYLDGANFVIENRPGANGAIAARAASQASADGYTLFSSTVSTHAANPHLFATLGYDPLEDFQAVGIIGSTAPVLLRGPNFAVDSIEALLDRLKNTERPVNFAVTNASSELATLWFAHVLDLDAQVIPYKSGPQALTDLASGQVDLLFGDVASSRGLVEAKTLTPLAVASSERLEVIPEIPTLQEAGVPDVDVQIWVGLFAPKGVPQPTVAVLNQAMTQALQENEIRQALLATGVSTMDFNQMQADAFVRSQYELWERLVDELDIEKR